MAKKTTFHRFEDCRVDSQIGTNRPQVPVEKTLPRPTKVRISKWQRGCYGNCETHKTTPHLRRGEIFTDEGGTDEGADCSAGSARTANRSSCCCKGATMLKLPARVEHGAANREGSFQPVVPPIWNQRRYQASQTRNPVIPEASMSMQVGAMGTVSPVNVSTESSNSLPKA